MTASALFEGGESLWTPTDLASGPWDPAHCHGGPPAALLARKVFGKRAKSTGWAS